MRQKTIWTLLDDIIDFNNRWFPSWRDRPTIYYSNAMAGEVGEICNATKKMMGGGTNRVTIPNGYDLVEEVVDVLIYGILLCGSIGYDQNAFMNIAYKKLDALEERMKARTVEGKL